MSSADVLDAALAIVAAAVEPLDPTPYVVLGPPRVINGDQVIYLYHDGSFDVEKAGPGIIRRHHIIAIRAMMLTTADDAQVERDMLAIHDLLSTAFYANHRLNNTVATSDLDQRDGIVNGAAPMYVEEHGREFRQRWWTLNAEEQLTVVLS